MPGNIVTINSTLKWYVADSRMSEVEEFLDRIGFRLPTTPLRSLEDCEPVEVEGAPA